jgi:hypothetical protein
LQKRPQGRGGEPLSERRDHAAGDEDIPRHGPAEYNGRLRFEEPFFHPSTAFRSRGAGRKGPGNALRTRRIARPPGALLRLGHARAARRGRSDLIENTATRLAGRGLRLTGLDPRCWRRRGALRGPCSGRVEHRRCAFAMGGKQR